MTGRPPEDFTDFVTAALPRLLRLGRMLAGSASAGDDVVQSALVSTLAAWPRVRREEDPFAYVRRAMVNANVSRWRKWAARVRLTDPPEVAGPSEAGLAVDRLAVRAALARLPARQRTVLVLRYFCDLSEREIAAEMRCHPGTVKSQAARGLAAMRALLDESDAQPGSAEVRFR